MRRSNPWRLLGLGKPQPFTVLVYSLTVTVLAVYASTYESLAVLVALTGIPGLVAGILRYRLLVALLPLTIVGTFLNALAIYYLGVAESPGEIVASLGPIVVPEFAVDVTSRIGGRVISFAGAGMLLAALVTPRDAIRSLSDELGIPKGLSFSLSFALRMLPLLRSDMEDLLLVRRLRGHRRVPLTPGDYGSLITPLLRTAIDRALWVGLAAELRGFRLRRARRRLPRLGLLDLILLLALTLQALAVILYG